MRDLERSRKDYSSSDYTALQRAYLSDITKAVEEKKYADGELRKLQLMRYRENQNQFMDNKHNLANAVQQVVVEVPRLFFVPKETPRDMKSEIRTPQFVPFASPINKQMNSNFDPYIESEYSQIDQIPMMTAREREVAKAKVYEDWLKRSGGRFAVNRKYLRPQCNCRRQ